MRALLALAVLAAFALAGCSGSDSPTDNPAGDQNATVTMSDNNFNPTTRNILVGSVVEWTNTGANPHTATADDGSFDSGTVAPGGTWDHTFDEAGDYPYHCKIHPSMTGTIKVDDKVA